MERLNELESKFLQISEQYVKTKEELVRMKKAESMMQATSQNPLNRDYKEKYLDMREINKDLKRHFRELEEKVAQLIAQT